MIDTLGIRWIGKIDRKGKLIEVGDIIGVSPYKKEYAGITEEGYRAVVWVKDRRKFVAMDDYMLNLIRDVPADMVMSGQRSQLEVINRCTCSNWGEDDGQTTCWLHHNCQNGDCTHME
jgi:hypothetical protein